MTCSLCGKPIEERITQVARQVVGWDVPRKQGGQNALFLRRETGAYAHVSCVKIARNTNLDQDRLWSESAP